MTDYFRGKTLICEQTKPRTYFTPVFQRIGDSLKLHHMEADCLSYQHSKKMLPVEHMGKRKRRIFELEDENAKLRELVREIWRSCAVSEDDCVKCPHHHIEESDEFWCDIPSLMEALGIEVEE